MSYNDKNIFAKILNGDAECVKVLENDFILAFMDVMPQAPGHTLVIPKYKTEKIVNIKKKIGDRIQSLMIFFPSQLLFNEVFSF